MHLCNQDDPPRLPLHIAAAVAPQDGRSQAQGRHATDAPKCNVAQLSMWVALDFGAVLGNRKVCASAGQ